MREDFGGIKPLQNLFGGDNTPQKTVYGLKLNSFLHRAKNIKRELLY